MEDEFIYSDTDVKSEERIVRFILFPKDWDGDTNELAEGFVTLRLNEKGVSCVRYDYLGGENATIKEGQTYSTSVNNRKSQKAQKNNISFEPEQLIGWGHCTAQQIIGIDPDIIKLEVDAGRPCHVTITFNKDGDTIKGIVKDAYILELFEKIQDEFEYYYFDDRQVKNV